MILRTKRSELRPAETRDASKLGSLNEGTDVKNFAPSLLAIFLATSLLVGAQDLPAPQQDWLACAVHYLAKRQDPRSGPQLRAA